MPLLAKEAPKDVLTSNQWTMEVDGIPRATFVSISGITRAMQSIERADGGTGIVYKFPDQRIMFGDLQLARMYDPQDANDLSIESFLDGVIATGKKLNGEVLKYHFGAPLFRFQFTGMLFISESHPQMNKAQSGPYVVSYNARVDYWEKVAATA